MAVYTIKQVSEKFNLPSSTLRYYEEVGILTNVERTERGQRIYRQEHLNRIGSICCFKGTGMSIAKLQEFFRYEENEPEHIDDILKLLGQQKEQVEKQLCQLKTDYEHVQRKLDYYHGIKQALEAKAQFPQWSEYKVKHYDT